MNSSPLHRVSRRK